MEQKMIKKQEVELDLITLKTTKLPYPLKQGDTNVHEITLILNAEDTFEYERAQVHYSNGDYQDIEGLTFIIKNSALKTGNRSFEVEFVSGEEVRRSGKVEYRVDRSINSEYEAFDKYSELKKLYDVYVELKGGEGDTGSIGNLNAEDIETALGFMPVNPVGGVTTKRKETAVTYLLDTPNSETNIDLSASDTIMVIILANNVYVNFVNMNTAPNTNDTVKIIYDNNDGYDAYINTGAIIDGQYYDPYVGTYRIPDGVGVIEFNFVSLGSGGVVDTVVFGTTGGGPELTKNHMVQYKLGDPDSSTDIDIGASNTIEVVIQTNNVSINFVNMNIPPSTNHTVRMIYANNDGYDAYINDGILIDGQYCERYRIPDGSGVIEFDFLSYANGMMAFFGTTGGGAGVNLDDIDARALNGYTQADFVLTVYHGADANAYRPSNAGVVMWIGTVEPQNAIDNDIWIGG